MALSTRTADAALELAESRAEAGDDPDTYLLAYSSGRNRAQQGCDVEADWLLLKANHSATPAMLAGFLEGLASTREFPKGGGR